jgi:hypothetical protein
LDVYKNVYARSAVEVRKMDSIFNNLVQVGICSGDKIEKNEMGGVCSVNGGEERRVQGFGGET